MRHFPEDEWVRRLAMKLRELLPEVSGDDALSMALAEATFPECVGGSPEEAVEAIALRSRLMRLERYRKTISRVI